MDDDSFLNLIVYVCPSYRVRAVLDVLEQWSLDAQNRPSAGGLLLGEAYRGRGFRGVHGLVSSLTMQAPELSFMAWEDPSDMYNGEVVYYTPQLGRFSTASDGDGDPLFCLADVEKILAIPDAEARAHALGQPWRETFRDHRNPMLVMEPPRLEVCWDRGDGGVLICRSPDDSQDEHRADLVIPFPAEFSAESVDELLAECDLIRAQDWSVPDPCERYAWTEVYPHVAEDGTSQPATVDMHYITSLPAD
jgi:hypothetical protein